MCSNRLETRRTKALRVAETLAKGNRARAFALAQLASYVHSPTYAEHAIARSAFAN